jgi:hypothetical protein
MMMTMTTIRRLTSTQCSAAASGVFSLMSITPTTDSSRGIDCDERRRTCIATPTARMTAPATPAPRPVWALAELDKDTEAKSPPDLPHLPDLPTAFEQPSDSSVVGFRQHRDSAPAHAVKVIVQRSGAVTCAVRTRCRDEIRSLKMALAVVLSYFINVPQALIDRSCDDDATVRF